MTHGKNKKKVLKQGSNKHDSRTPGNQNAHNESTPDSPSKSNKSVTFSDKVISNMNYPFVSVCTPTFNRRPFIPATIKCFLHQDYPMDRMEWIIIDDGTDKVEDLFKNVPNVKYFKYDTKMPLGKKRNLMHEKSKGDIIVYMDDDDYYPPERVSHAVKRLQDNPQALAAGSTLMYIFFKHNKEMWQFGPYGPNHATAGTFAFRRELLRQTKYDETACLAEECAFLKKYTIPFVQLDPEKVILCFSHEQNTFDKRKLLENINPQVTRRTNLTVESLIPNKELRDFYLNKLDKLLEAYLPGKPEMKPDVLEQIKTIEEKRKHDIEKFQKRNAQLSGVVIAEPGKEARQLSTEEVIGLLQGHREEIVRLNAQVEVNNKFIEALKTKVAEHEKTIKTLKSSNVNSSIYSSTEPNKPTSTYSATEINISATPQSNNSLFAYPEINEAVGLEANYNGFSDTQGLLLNIVEKTNTTEKSLSKEELLLKEINGEL
jgi:glycosyltransferase involved in cell wall biosynthesis